MKAALIVAIVVFASMLGVYWFEKLEDMQQRRIKISNTQIELPHILVCIPREIPWAEEHEKYLSEALELLYDKVQLQYDANYIRALIMTESSGDWKAKNEHAVGLMQITESQFKDVKRTYPDLQIEWEDLEDPVNNIVVGALYFNELYNFFNGHKMQGILQIMQYNWGFNNVVNWIATRPDNQFIDESVPQETISHLLDTIYWYFVFESLERVR